VATGVQIAVQRGGEALLDLVAKVDDLVDPATARLLRRDVFEQQKMLQDARDPAPQRIALLLPKSAISSARCAQSSAAFGRIRPSRLSSLA